MLKIPKTGLLIFVMLCATITFRSNAGMSVNYDDMFARAINGDKQYADSLKIHATEYNSDEAADYYAYLLQSKTSPFYDIEKYNVWVDNWYERTEIKANQGDDNACLSLGRALTGDFTALRPTNPDYNPADRGISFMLQAAMKGNGMAQYLYAVYNDRLSDSEKELWISEAAKNGHVAAIVNLAILELDKGNYDKTISHLNTVIENYSNYIFDDRISVKDLIILANYLKSNPNFSLTGFGPIKDDDTTFYLSRDGQILACATYRGKAGLLQLNNKGERINHDDIPFIYNFIIPITHEQLRLSESSLFFQVNPYTFNLSAKESEIRALDKTGNECYFNMWSAYGAAIPVPDDYIYDTE